MNKKNEHGEKVYNSFKRTISENNVPSIRNMERNIWRSTSLSNIVNYAKTINNSQDDGAKNNCSSILVETVKPKRGENKTTDVKLNSIVTIVVIEAKGLPLVSEDGATHNLFCKFRLGSSCYKTKAVASTAQPNWGERFIMHLQKDEILNVSIWDKAKQKNFMGSCILDLSSYERERTHEIWQELDDGYGRIHLSITICVSNINNSSLTNNLFNLEDIERTKYIYDLKSNWQLVGLLHVNIFGAKGLLGKPNAYCVLEVDNERVQTPKEGPNSEPAWNKSYVFNVYDVTSTLDLKVYGRSFTSALIYESLGKVSIPLLTITNGEKRWYALKDKNKRYIAKGNCPRLHLQMTLIWNPVKASLKLFRPKPAKYIKKPKKYDVGLMHSNVEFIREVFEFLYDINESFKRLFEWDDPEFSFIALSGWLVFCYYLRLWTIPLILLLPFIYHWFFYRKRGNKNNFLLTVSETSDEDSKNCKKDKSLPEKLHDLPHTTIVVTNGIEYIASVAERLYNLMSFKVPFLSYLTMMILVIASVVLYLIPFNYLLMSLGIYKYTRKYLNPDRVLNNDLIDFLSRIPDNNVLEDWKEFSVPEPIQKTSSDKLARSISTEVPS